MSPNKNGGIVLISYNSGYQTTGQYIYKCRCKAHFSALIRQISTLFVEVSRIFVEVSRISVEVLHTFSLHYGFHIYRSTK
jgi:hypothetical protein